MPEVRVEHRSRVFRVSNSCALLLLERFCYRLCVFSCGCVSGICNEALFFNTSAKIIESPILVFFSPRSHHSLDVCWIVTAPMPSSYNHND